MAISSFLIKINVHFKTPILILTCAISTHLSASHDSSWGIYRNAEDFKNERITYAPQAGIKYKFKIHITRKFIDIHIGDSSYNLQFDSIYGYRDAAGNVHRIYNNVDYIVLNPRENIQLYSFLQVDGGKGNYEHTEYFFSPEIGEKIYPLTIYNLKIAFPTAQVFHELLDMYFADDKQLTVYDKFYHIYKINRVYQFSKQIPIITK